MIGARTNESQTASPSDLKARIISTVDQSLELTYKVGQVRVKGSDDHLSGEPKLYDEWHNDEGCEEKDDP